MTVHLVLSSPTTVRKCSSPKTMSTLNLTGTSSAALNRPLRITNDGLGKLVRRFPLHLWTTAQRRPSLSSPIFTPPSSVRVWMMPIALRFYNGCVAPTLPSLTNPTHFRTRRSHPTQQSLRPLPCPHTWRSLHLLTFPHRTPASSSPMSSPGLLHLLTLPSL